MYHLLQVLGNEARPFGVSQDLLYHLLQEVSAVLGNGAFARSFGVSEDRLLQVSLGRGVFARPARELLYHLLQVSLLL